MAGKDGRSRNWNFILYPESAPENWRELIDEMHIEWVESPLHDKDTNPDGTEKKPHHHISLLYPSDKAYEQVKEITVNQLLQPIPIKCQSVKGSIRYMVHKDNPEKYQYNWNDIKPHGGADLYELCSPTFGERFVIQKDIFDFIRSNDITEFSDLIDCIEKIGNDDWFKVAVNFSTISIKTYLDSRRYKKEKYGDKK